MEGKYLLLGKQHLSHSQDGVKFSLSMPIIHCFGFLFYIADHCYQRSTLNNNSKAQCWFPVFFFSSDLSQLGYYPNAFFSFYGDGNVQHRSWEYVSTVSHCKEGPAVVKLAMLHLNNLGVGPSLLLKCQVLSEVKNILDFKTKNKQREENPKQN